MVSFPVVFHHQVELPGLSEVVIERQFNDGVYLCTNLPFFRIKPIVRVEILYHIGRLRPFLLGYGEAILLGQFLQRLLASSPLKLIRNLVPIFVHPNGYNVVMLPLNVKVLVDDIRLVSIAHLLHVLPDEHLDLLVTQVLSLAWIDGGVERAVLAAEASVLIYLEGVHRPLWILYFRGGKHRGLTLGDFPLIVTDGRATAGRRRIDLRDHSTWSGRCRSV